MVKHLGLLVPSMFSDGVRLGVCLGIVWAHVVDQVLLILTVLMPSQTLWFDSFIFCLGQVESLVVDLLFTGSV